jgi:hypothetical protein
MRIPGWQAQFSEYKTKIYYAGHAGASSGAGRLGTLWGHKWCWVAHGRRKWTQLGTEENCRDCGDRCLGYGGCLNGSCVCNLGRPKCGSDCCYPWEKCCGTECIDAQLDCCDPTKNFHCDDRSEKCCGLNNCFNPEEFDCCGVFPDNFGCDRRWYRCCGNICIPARHCCRPDGTWFGCSEGHTCCGSGQPHATCIRDSEQCCSDGEAPTPFYGWPTSLQCCHGNVNPNADYCCEANKGYPISCPKDHDDPQGHPIHYDCTSRPGNDGHLVPKCCTTDTPNGNEVCY